jgi:hypothetical protein
LGKGQSVWITAWSPEIEERGMGVGALQTQPRRNLSHTQETRPPAVVITVNSVLDQPSWTRTSPSAGHMLSCGVAAAPAVCSHQRLFTVGVGTGPGQWA